MRAVGRKGNGMDIVKVPSGGELMDPERLCIWLTSYQAGMPFTPFSYYGRRSGYPYDYENPDDAILDPGSDSYHIPVKFHIRGDRTGITFDAQDEAYREWYARSKPFLASGDIWVWHDGRTVYHGRIIGPLLSYLAE